MRTILSLYCLLLTLMLILTSPVHAQGAGAGDDMWIRTFEQWGLFTPHEDYCDSSTEVFVAISGTASRGFCIEKDERTAAAWEAARDDCASDKKRLPEPGEWKYACVNAVGLNNMTDDDEWVSNFALPFAASPGRLASAAAGGYSGSCADISHGIVGSYGAGSHSLVYRCVR